MKGWDLRSRILDDVYLQTDTERRSRKADFGFITCLFLVAVCVPQSFVSHQTSSVFVFPNSASRKQQSVNEDTRLPFSEHVFHHCSCDSCSLWVHICRLHRKNSCPGWLRSWRRILNTKSFFIKMCSPSSCCCCRVYMVCVIPFLCIDTFMFLSVVYFLLPT